MPITDTKLRNAKAGPKPYKITDGRGLYLLVTTAGNRYWKFRWEHAGKEKTLPLGEYPSMGLAAAREASTVARTAVKAGKQPGLPTDPAATFEAVAKRWHSRNADRWAPKHAEDVIDSMVRDLFPPIGALNVRDIDVPTMLAALRAIEDRGAVETARRVAQRAGMVFTFAIGEGLAVANPATTIRPALKHPVKGRQPAIVKVDALRAMLAAADAQAAHPTTKLALRLLAITAVRPGSITGAQWSEFEGLDGSEPLWRVPAARMKGKAEHKAEHVVPLPPEAVAVLDAARELNGGGNLIFPSVRNIRKPMSANAIGYLLNRSGYHGHHVPHGWRAAFSTVMNERHRADKSVIDLMLAHVPSNKVEGAYNRAEHMERRRELAAEWAALILADAMPAERLLDGPRR